VVKKGMVAYLAFLFAVFVFPDKIQIVANEIRNRIDGGV